MKTWIYSLPMALGFLGTLWVTDGCAQLPDLTASAGGRIRVACIGDSITQGAGADFGKSYPSQLQELLGDKWEVGNFGVSGRTLLRKGDNPYWNEKAFQQAQAFKPDAVVIMLGTNDTKPQNWVHQDEFYSDYKDLVGTFQGLDNKPRIFVCRPCPVPEPGNYGINETNIQLEIPLIDKLAQEEQLQVIDMHAALESLPQLLPDRVHPNTKGALVMAETVYKELTGGKPLPMRANHLFADNAVLQRDQEVPVWGTAGDGESVTVAFNGQSVSTVAKDGKWMLRLQPMPANSTPQDMTLSSGDRTIVLKNILVGDVWLCSGQSNMERQLGPRPPQPDVENWKDEVAQANHPEIRQYYVNQTKGPYGAPQESVTGSWSVCSPQTAANFTAVGYFFARDLQKALDVPIGIIHASWGGTQASVWISGDAFKADPELEKMTQGEEQITQKYRTDLADYNAKLDQYNKDAVQAQQDGKPAPTRLQRPQDPLQNTMFSTGLYNGMIAPLQPFSIRGVVWYQGESDAGHGKIYPKLMAALIGGWRKAWGEGDFPFLLVQIAPNSGWDPAIREAQLLTWKKTPGTAMVVTTDIGSVDAHPPHKQLVGERLALAARALVFGEKLEFSGPVYETVDLGGGQAVLHFSHVGSGLAAKDGDLKGFEISGDGKNFVPAKATIAGETVVVSSDQVANPQAVRFGWSGVPDVNFFNQEGLPASPFCTNPE